jgi:predicted N-acetyltransferase YhbS
MLFREAQSTELDAVLRTHKRAFRQDDEAILVDSLLRDTSAQPFLSVVAESEEEIAGHALFTSLTLVGSQTPTGCSILAPLAVLPKYQRSGVGRGLIDFGCKLLAERSIDLVFVLGDPQYYTRCGFTPAVAYRLHAPYAIEPEDAWMVRPLRPQVLGNVHGTVRCAQALAAEQYWRE